MRRWHQLFLYLVVNTLIACVPVKRSNNIVFDPVNKLTLNVFAPEKQDQQYPVLVFIHGGNWLTGEKETYNFFGKGMAGNGIVTAIIDYRLSPATDYKGMAKDAATAVNWIKENIKGYGGDTSKIFVSGHSAGGHLAALIMTDSSYFQNLKITNPVKGSILIDPFGLDMESYLLNSTNKKDKIYLPIFSTDTNEWKKASPINYLNAKQRPFLVYIGSNTYAAIKTDVNNFMKKIKYLRPETKLIEVEGKRHAGMILQFYKTNNKRYREIIEFMKQ